MTSSSVEIPLLESSSEMSAPVDLIFICIGIFFFTSENIQKYEHENEIKGRALVVIRMHFILSGMERCGGDLSFSGDSGHLQGTLADSAS